MGRASRKHSGALAIAATAILAGGAAGAIAAAGASTPGTAGRARGKGYTAPLGQRTIPRNAERLTVGGPASVQPIKPGFLGLSLEYTAIEPYAGTNPSELDPVFLQLIRNITPYQAPVLRIGGDTTDWTWWPVPHMQKPGGVRYTLTPRWLAVMSALTKALSARLILGLDLEADSNVLARYEALKLATGIGHRPIEAFEPGNEPELYGSWDWYLTPDGRGVTGRPPSWDFPAFQGNFASVHRALGGIPLAGPSTGSAKWISYLGQFLGAAPYLSLVTLHRYPLQLCFTPTSAANYPTISNLLSAAASTGLAASIAGDVRLAHARGLPIRIDEINTNACGSAPRVTNTFASALWALDTLFAMASVGVDGVNIHTYPSASYRLFRFARTRGRWHALVAPEYYGLEMFALGAPPRSRLLRVSGPATSNVSAWATRATDGSVRITLINDSLRSSRTVAIRAPISTTAALVRLTAPSAYSQQNVTIAGLGFGSRTYTGLPTGRLRAERISPIRGQYVVRLPPASAALLGPS